MAMKLLLNQLLILSFNGIWSNKIYLIRSLVYIYIYSLLNISLYKYFIHFLVFLSKLLLHVYDAKEYFFACT